jgi:hypothetical protein
LLHCIQTEIDKRPEVANVPEDVKMKMKRATKQAATPSCDPSNDTVAELKPATMTYPVRSAQAQRVFRVPHAGVEQVGSHRHAQGDFAGQPEFDLFGRDDNLLNPNQHERGSGDGDRHLRMGMFEGHFAQPDLVQIQPPRFSFAAILRLVPQTFTDFAIGFIVVLIGSLLVRRIYSP